jgi:NADH-quinone oxidoreductase subunit N
MASMVYLLFVSFIIIWLGNFSSIYFFGFFYQTPATQLFKFVLIIFSILWLILLKETYLIKKPLFSLYLSLIFVFLLASFLIIIQLNIFGIFICLEIQNILLFAFLSLDKKNIYTYKQIFHYFLLSSFISGIMAMGCALIYTSSGTLDVIYIEHLLVYLKNNFYFLSGTFLLFLGFVFKLGLFPFLFWIPAIFRIAPISGLFVSAVLSKLVYFFVLMSNLHFLFFFYKEFLFFISIISIFFCVFLAIREYTIRGVIGYSSVVQTSFLSFGIPVSSINLNAAVFFYLLIYCLTMCFIIFCIMILERRKSKAKIIYIYELRGIGVSNFMFSICFAIAIFSLAGLPPFPGFFGKLFLVIQLFDSDLIFLALFILIYTLIVMFYYIRLVVLMFSGRLQEVKNEKIGEFISTSITIFIISCFITWNVWVLINYNLLWTIALFLSVFL